MLLEYHIRGEYRWVMMKRSEANQTERLVVDLIDKFLTCSLERLQWVSKYAPLDAQEKRRKAKYLKTWCQFCGITKPSNNIHTSWWGKPAFHHEAGLIRIGERKPDDVDVLFKRPQCGGCPTTRLLLAVAGYFAIALGTNCMPSVAMSRPSSDVHLGGFTPSVLCPVPRRIKRPASQYVASSCPSA